MHSHSHGHHGHYHGGTGRFLGWSFVATVLFVGLETLAGLKAGSLALLSDAGHNLTDALAIMFTLFAFYLQSKPADSIKTYGYHRMGVLAAFVNALTLMGLSAWIFWESFERLRHPQPVQETIMIVVAAVGLLMNGGIMWGLRAASKNDLNVRSTFIHMLGDALGSVAIIVGGIAIHYTGLAQIDPALSVAIAALIVWTAWDIVKESLNILLEGLPRGIELHDVIKAMRDVPGVLGVHDLHIWSLGSSTHALSCHVQIEDVALSECKQILQQLNGTLCDRFAIHHTTVQFEHVGCEVAESGCVIPGGAHSHQH